MNVKEWLLKNNLLKEVSELEMEETEIENEENEETEVEIAKNENNTDDETIEQNELLKQINTLNKALDEQTKINARILKQLTPHQEIANVDECFNSFDRYKKIEEE